MALNPYAAPQAELELALQPADTPRLVAWSGRIGRVQFFVFFLLGLVLPLFYFFVAGTTVQMWDISLAEGAPALRFLGASSLIFSVLVLGAAIRRRLHDFDVSGWWILLLLVPLFQFIFLIYLLVAPGTLDANRFGPPPVPNGTVVTSAAVACGLLLGSPIVLRFL